MGWSGEGVGVEGEATGVEREVIRLVKAVQAANTAGLSVLLVSHSQQPFCSDFTSGGGAEQWQFGNARLVSMLRMLMHGSLCMPRLACPGGSLGLTWSYSHGIGELLS